MIEYVDISVANSSESCSEVLAKWAEPMVKVVVARPDRPLTDVRQFYESIFQYLGTPAAYAEDARIGGRDQQRTGEIWMEIRFDPSIQNAYRHSREAQPLHTDGSYIPGFPNSSLLCCVTNAAEGGETVFIDAAQVAELLARDEPTLYEQLTSTKVPHARSGDRRDDYVLKQVNGTWFVNWNYYCVSDEERPEIRDMAEALHGYLRDSPAIRDSLCQVKLAPGEAVMWKDNEVLHGRNAFQAAIEGERFIWKCAFDVGQF